MLARTPLLLRVTEQEEEKRWKKARKHLKRAVKRAHKRVEQKVKRAEQKGPRGGETPQNFAQRLLKKQDKFTRKVFGAKQKRLAHLQSREQRRFDQYTASDPKPEQQPLGTFGTGEPGKPGKPGEPTSSVPYTRPRKAALTRPVRTRLALRQTG